MTMETLMFQLSDGVVCRKTTGDLRMLFDRRKGVMYELNETASAVVEHLTTAPATTDHLVASLEREFDAPLEEIRGDVERLLADFVDAGLLSRQV